MKKLPLILSVGSVALLLVGCPASDQANQSPPITQETPTPSPSPPAAQPPAFSDAVQPATEPAPPRVTGLIPATDPDQKRAEINHGRSDPFAIFPLQPNITITEEEKPPAGTSATTGAPAAGGNRPAAAPTRMGNRPTPRPPIVKAPPPPPQPTEAAAVQVLGIVQLPTSPMAIVKAPGEATERRVTPGSTLSNGLVLVKAIDTNADNPSIVLEQYGQTVTRRLGDGVPEPAAPQASISYNISESGE
ncbi:hypothetical protein MiAbW_00098 [Microcystis aeruginosa NIES-4325]|uniref:Uncharacterized protein n=1 Tax=Microcystis aeruginosa NIES-4325 TaxID=2569534 RepID=A0A5J4F2E2_MICAE|nr:hypothetical protein [Microcystis aeruginosa]GEA25562.1 hypothetical protein MiAbW_00098 [Microcystis aeruginosa NIES-4325]